MIGIIEPSKGGKVEKQFRIADLVLGQNKGLEDWAGIHRLLKRSVSK